MNNSWRMALIAGALSTAAVSASGKTGRAIAPAQPLRIHLYDQAQVPGGVLHSAIGEATRIFKAAGTPISWEQPPTESPEAWITDMTALPRALDQRQYLVVRLRRRTPATLFRGALGFALPMAQTGVHASVFYDRVEALRAWVNLERYVILGHAIAHEIGHVLLGSPEHAPGGLMQANWHIPLTGKSGEVWLRSSHCFAAMEKSNRARRRKPDTAKTGPEAITRNFRRAGCPL